MARQLTHKKRLIAIRDGKECFYCGIDLPKDELTVEHILSKIDGGSDHMHNLCLACKPCNKAVGTMAVVRKIKYREEKREHINQ